MKRSHLKYLLWLLPLLAVAGWFACCGGRHNYVEYLPTDARLVARVDVQTLSDKGLLSLLPSSQRWHIDDLQEAGLRTDVPAYVFATAEGGFGLLASMKSARRFEAWLREKGFDVESQRGLKWYGGGKWLLAFDRRKLMVMDCVLTSDANTARRQLADLMKEKHSPSMHLTQVEGEPGAVAVSASLDMLPSAWREPLAKLLSFENELHSTRFVADLSFGENDINLDARLCDVSAETKAHIDDLLGLLRPINGALLNVGPSRPAAWICANLDGESLLPFLRKDIKLRLLLLALNFCVDADEIIRSVNGDVSLHLSKASTEIKECCLAAQLKNEYFLQNAPQWGRGSLLSSVFRFSALGPRDFILRGDDTAFCFGAHDGLLYLAPSEELSAEVLRRNESPIAPRQDVEGRLLYASFDAARWIEKYHLDDYVGASFPSLLGLTNGLQRVSVALGEEQHVALKFVFDRPINELMKNSTER
ncbi:MAG: DUF4836 family protein [Bacteroidaceae bacterium]|nr:DUF4836 family protein [Bacteroidaceae bacterium]